MNAEHDTNITSLTRIAFVTWVAINSILKLILICVCFKALSNTFHHLSVICFLVSDICVSTVVAVYTLTRQFTNTTVCAVQFFLILFCLLLNYSFLLLICVHRIIILKTLNFGSVKQRFEVRKYWIIAGTIFFPFLYQLSVSVVMPRKTTIPACSSPSLYGHLHPVFIALNIVPNTIILISVVVLYAVGSRIIWRRFLRVSPDQKQTRSENEVQESSTNNQPGHSKIVGVKHANTKKCRNVVWASFDDLSVRSLDEISLQKYRTARIEVVENEEQSRSSDTSDVESHKTTENPQVDVENQGVADRQCNKKSWEIRAFFSCLIIAAETVILTGPIVFLYWIDILNTKPTDVQVKIILSFPYLLAGVINLFVYSWRFEEVRKTFKQCCRCS